MATPLSLYNLTLQKAQAIPEAVYGNFSAPKAQEIVVSRGKVLELLRPDDDTGKVQSVLATEVFGIIRCMIPFRSVSGGTRDYLAIGSDSGRLTILQFDAEKVRWKKIHEETFGKSGCRRTVPGQYIAVDPKGRALMIGAIEKQKLVYVLNRDASSALTISSPLEANKTHTLVYDICGVDVGFENPVFACIEADYDKKIEEFDEFKRPKPSKFLTFYELDLGLNHVTRKWSEKIDSGANKCMSVPGGANGPGGVLICAENRIIYKNQGHATVSAPIPRRFGIPDDKGVLITAAATHIQKNLFFFLLQSEYGDIYKVTLDWAEEGEEATVSDLHVKYFDTVPVATSLCVLKTGFLFVSAEVSNHYLFQFQGIGDDDDSPFTSSKSEEFVYFQPRNIANLALIDEMESLGPILDMKVADLAKEHTPQIYTLCGRGPRSSLRILRHGLAVTEMAVSELPGNPSAVWAVKTNAADAYCTYIVVSFSNWTIVLSIGETVVEVTDSGILDSTKTLSLSLLGENSLLQIHPNGIRHIRGDKQKRINEWKTPGKKTIVTSAVNERQVVIGLTGGELVYFELDNMGQLMDVHRKEMRGDIACLAIGPVPEGRQRCGFMVVGSQTDNTVRVLSLDPSQPMNQLTLQAMPAQPQALCLVSMQGANAHDSSASLHLYVGLQNGVMMRSVVDEADGRLTDTRKRFLGTRPVKLFQVTVHAHKAVLALSTRAWLSYTYQGRYNMAPLSYEVLEHCSAFTSEQCPEGLVCISENTLRIVTLERLGELFNQTVVPLRYTPRKMLIHEETNNLIIIESDHNSYSYKVKKELQATLRMDDDEEEGKEKKEDEDSGPSEAFVGSPQAGPNKWASCIRIVDPVQGETISLLELEDNEAAFSMCQLRFAAKPGETTAVKDDMTELYLVVGTVKDYQILPPKCPAAFLRVYKFVNNDTQLKLLHKTPVDRPPLALAAFQKRLVVGLGNFLRIYDLGKKKLLRKSENKNFPTSITGIHVIDARIFVTDAAESVFLVRYNKQEKMLEIFADTDVPRYITCSTLVDFDTIVCGDKFGNIFAGRLPAGVTEDLEKDPFGAKDKVVGRSGESLTVGPPRKLMDIVNYHVGEIVTSIQKTTLMSGGVEVLIYSTIMGGLGILIPFTSKEDVDFFTHLEMHVRQENNPLCGRDHLAFRSYYFPVKDCIDGDLCEQYTTLDWDRQAAIGEELVRNPAEVSKKLEEMRNRVL